MPAKGKPKDLIVWLDGKLIRSSAAKVPILTHSLQYGSGIFEGIRAYETEDGPAIFRLDDHIRRFLGSAKIYSMEMGHTQNDLAGAVRKVVKANRLKSCYIRPFAFYNDSSIGISVSGKKVSVFIAAIPFGAYFGAGKDKGITCKVSSWHRINSLILPPEAKTSGNYVNSILASIEAKDDGADEAILTSIEGYVAEGPGENIFLVQDGKLLTPSRDSDILLGITRDSIIKIARSMGMDVVERNIHKEELYTCDEAFFVGTAAEVTPIVSIDSRKIGKGRPGPVTKMLWDRYSAIVHGHEQEFKAWLTYIS